jgi:hypothetical protein
MDKPFFSPRSDFVTDPSHDGSATPHLLAVGLNRTTNHGWKAIIALDDGGEHSMARGWESKSVEAQQEDAAGRTTSQKPHLTRENAARLRDKENLRLSIQSVLQQLERSHDARHRALLERAMSDLERRIRELDS